MIRKRSSRKDLALGAYLIVDNKYESQYFKISDLQNELTSGKNIFKIKGNARLLDIEQPIEIEVTMPGVEDPIYHEVNKYLDDAGRRIITIFVYPELPAGLATLTVTGVARFRPGGRRVPPAFRGKQNVRWQRDIYIEPNKPNITPIIFPKQPRITITENVKTYMSESFGGGETVQNTLENPAGGSISYTVTYPTSPVNPSRGFVQPRTFGNDLQIHATGFEFSSSMVGGTITIPNPSSTATPAITNTPTSIPSLKTNGNPNTQDFTASIVEVLNSSTIRVDKRYEWDYYYTYTQAFRGSGQGLSTSRRSTYSPNSFTSNNFKITYTGTTENFTITNHNYVSYANIILANIDPIAGDVNSTKIYMKTHGLQTWDLLAEERIESREMLVDTASVYNMKRLGIFDSSDQSAINQWTVSTQTSLASPAAPEIKVDSEHLMEAMLISGSKALAASTTRDQDYVKVQCSKPLQVFRDCNYTIAYKAAAFGEEDDNRKSNNIGIPELRVYISGSGMDGGIGAYKNEDCGRYVGRIKAPTPPSNIYQASPKPTKFNNYNIMPYPAQNFAAGVGRSSVVVIGSSTQVGNVPDLGEGALPLIDKEYTVHTFKADHDGFIHPTLLVKFGKWVITDIQIRSSVESGFTPNHTILEARVPQYQEDDILDFKVEFYNYAGERADLIVVLERISFEGGNFYSNGEGWLGEGIIFDGQFG